MADVFISYVQAERALTQSLARDLEAAGLTVWWDSELLPSDDFQREIDRQLEECSAAIVIWTPKSIDSYWVRSEAQHAMRRRRLVNVRSAALDPEQIPKPFDVINSTLITNRESIINAVRKLMGMAPVPRKSKTDQRWWRRYSPRGLAAALVAGCLIAAAVLGGAVWLGGAGPPVPEWAMERTSFLGTMSLKWKYRSAPGQSMLFEIESYANSVLGLYHTDRRVHPYADGIEKEIDSVNGTRYFRVRGVGSQNRAPVTGWSRPLLITQYDTAYERIKATARVLVVVSDAQSQDIFKWISDSFQGFDVKLANAIVMELSRHLGGKKLEYPVRPVAERWGPMLRAPNEGRADLIISSITKLPEREKEFRIRFSDAYFCTGYAVIYRSDESERDIRDMIAGRRVGLQEDSTGAQLGEALATVAKFTPRFYNNTESITAAVLNAQIDFGITDALFAISAQISGRRGGRDRIAYREFQKNDFPASFPQAKQIQEYAVVVREDEAELLAAINGTIAELKKSGRLVEFLNEASSEYEAYRKVAEKSRPRWNAGDRPWECPR